MSWSYGVKAVLKSQLAAALAAVTLSEVYRQLPVDTVVREAVGDQLTAAKAAAVALAATVPGPYVAVNFNGHANACGFQSKSGWANDCIVVSVTQYTEENMRQMYPEDFAPPPAPPAQQTG